MWRPFSACPSFPMLMLLLMLPPGPVDAAIWSKSFVESSISDAHATSDGNYIVTGSTQPPGATESDVWVMKLDPSGNRLWEMAYGGTAADWGTAIREASDGGYYVGATTQSFGAQGSDCWILKLDGNGDVLWERRYGGLSFDWIRNITATGDGGVVVSGMFNQAQMPGTGVAKLDSSGDLQWSKVFWGGSGFVTICFAEEAANGDIFLASSYITGPGIDAWVMRLSPAGSVLWHKSYAGPGDDTASNGTATPDGGFLLVAYTLSFGTVGDHDTWIVSIDPSGGVQWETYIGAPGEEWVQGVAQGAGGGYLLSATTDSFTAPAYGLWFLKLGAEGRLESQFFFEVEGARMQVARAHDSGFLSAGWADFGTGSRDGWIIKTDSRGWSQSTCAPLVTTTATAHATSAAVQDLTFNVGVLSDPWTATNATVTTVTTTTECETVACDPLVCQAMGIVPEPACEGETQSFEAVWSGGEGPVTVEWDFDGDGTADAAGPSAVWTYPLGIWPVSAALRDECVGGAQTCELLENCRVLALTPPGEVSDVRVGDKPLRITSGSNALTIEADADAVAYNIYADRLGSWYAPGAATGSVCGITQWTDNGDGTVTMDYALPVDSWVVVTGSTSCAEGPAGTGSVGVERTLLGTWERCGPAP